MIFQKKWKWPVDGKSEFIIRFFEFQLYIGVLILTVFIDDDVGLSSICGIRFRESQLLPTMRFY